MIRHDGSETISQIKSLHFYRKIADDHILFIKSYKLYSVTIKHFSKITVYKTRVKNTL